MLALVLVIMLGLRLSKSLIPQNRQKTPPIRQKIGVYSNEKTEISYIKDSESFVSTSVYTNEGTG